MTISTQTNIVTYTGDGIATNFPFTFPVYDEDHFAIYRMVIATGVIDKTYNTSEYTANGIGDENGGSIDIIGTPVAATHKLIISREVPYDQLLDVENEGGFYPDNVERQLDLIEMQIQQLRERVNRSVKGFIGETFVDLPGPGGRANTFIGFDGSGNLDLFEDTGSSSTFDLSNVLRVPESVPEIADAATRANKFLKFDGSGDPTLAVGSATLADGDYGDITVGSSGTTMNIDAGVVGTTELADDAATYAKVQNVSATDKMLGRFSGGAGNIEELTISDFMQSMMDDANAAAAMTTLGFSAFFQTLVGGADASAINTLLGVSSSLTVLASSVVAGGGYIKFGAGGTSLITIQWVDASATANTTTVVNYPTAFNTWSRAWCNGVRQAGNAQDNDASVVSGSETTTTATVWCAVDDGQAITLWAIGV